MVNVKPVQLGKTERMSFARIEEVINMPNFIEVQKNSYQWFLDEGLKEVFRDISTIEDYTGFTREQKGVVEEKALQNGLLTAADEKAAQAVEELLGLMAEGYSIEVKREE